MSESVSHLLFIQQTSAIPILFVSSCGVGTFILVPKQNNQTEIYNLERQFFCLHILTDNPNWSSSKIILFIQDLNLFWPEELIVKPWQACQYKCLMFTINQVPIKLLFTGVLLQPSKQVNPSLALLWPTFKSNPLKPLIDFSIKH
jgi:hypothetical protein